MKPDQSGHPDHASRQMSGSDRMASVWIIGFFVFISACLLLVKWNTFQENTHRQAYRKYRKNLEYEQAVSHLESLLEIKPDRADYLRDLSRGYLGAGRPGQALEAIEHLRAVKPSADVNLEMGSICFEMGDPEKAEHYLQNVEKSVDYRKRDFALDEEKYRVAQCHYYMGRIHLDQGRFKKSADAFNMASISNYWHEKSVRYREQLSESFLGTTPKTF